MLVDTSSGSRIKIFENTCDSTGKVKVDASQKVNQKEGKLSHVNLFLIIQQVQYLAQVSYKMSLVQDFFSTYLTENSNF